MSHPTAPVVPTDRPARPGSRERRVLSTRLATRRAKVLAHLIDPPAVAEDVAMLTAQANDIARAFRPRNGWQDWLTSEIAVIMVRINRCSRIERKLRDYASYRAIDFWEEDQALAVETLAARLGRDPARVVAQLRQTPAGCDWLRQRWELLARVEPTAWTDEQRGLAANLGGDPTTAPTCAGFAQEQVAELIEQRERVEEADAIVRGLVEADLSDEIPGLARLRRYSRSLHRQMKWYVDQFHVEHPDRGDDPRRQPAFHASVPVEPDFEARPATAPPRVEAIPQNAETKPLPPTPPPQNAKTKPLGSVELTASLASAGPQPLISSPITASRPGAEPTDRPSRPRDPAHRQPAARRRAALAGSSRG